MTILAEQRTYVAGQWVTGDFNFDGRSTGLKKRNGRPPRGRPFTNGGAEP